MKERPMFSRWGVAAIVVGTFVLHIIGNARYGLFRDELYFIACSQHLAWGYVDQPPLVALAAWFAAPFGYALEAVRILPTLSTCATVLLAAMIARELGGGRYAQLMAAFCTAVLPVYLTIGSLLTTTSWEPMSWTLLLYLLLRIRREGDVRLWLLVALDATYGLYGKYSIALLIGALALGLLCTRERRMLATPWFALSVLLVPLLVLPNILWQWHHGWPFLGVVHGDAVQRHALTNGLQVEYVGVLQNAGAFILEQLIYTNPLLVPIWAAGLWLFARRESGLRAVTISYALLMLFCIFVQAKGYYAIGIYPTLLAAGCVAFERAAGRAFVWIRPVAVGLIAVVTAVLLPLLVALLPIDQFMTYSRVLGMTGQHGAPVHLIQPLYADEFGWDDVAQHVARIYAALPAHTRSQTAIFADSYSYASALNLYGPRYGLPPVISAHNSYYLWGTRGYDGSHLIAVGALQYHLLTRYFGSVQQVDVYTNPYRWVLEGPLPIYLVTRPRAPLAQIWPHLRHYGP